MSEPADQPLPRRIAVLFRVGLAVSSVSLVIGLLLRAFDVDPVGSGFVVAGCAVLILLPVLRLVLMVEHFGRIRDRTYVRISVVVLVLVALAAFVGLTV